MTAESIKQRIYSVDLLRGIVMMIMLLDHTRDFVHHNALMSDPTDPVTTTVPLFFTRWITHYCAPTFVFLSGVSIYLQKLSGKSNRQLSWFLFTRGVWLVILELTVIRFLVMFNLDYSSDLGFLQVIWVIGVSMIVMSVLIFLPIAVVGILGVLMIVLHNLADTRIDLPPQIAFGGATDLGQILWLVLHQQSLVPVAGGASVFVAYPLIPWVGVMAAGYALGVVYSWDAERRRRFLLAIGVIATVLFIGLRATNLYGDRNDFRSKTEFLEGVKAKGEAGELGPNFTMPTPAMSEPAFSIVSFFNTTKYPPSLLYLLMTLGPALIILSLTDGISGQALWQRVAIVFGRVPMFFYILQWISAHLVFGVGLSWIAGKDIGYFFQSIGPNMQVPPDNGFSLTVVYLAWIAGLILIYPLCLWYGNYKQRNKHWLLSYL
ncbi:MAG TPA: heparan-alpha-glucosaminide N-acetyltransferase domain-containing protein [Pyrinomonadaceae bacterium]|nr:heparan-alpha-glucosaminide N-acetyltransferase domain-containing protein [Pyrinomonadaceae bacterium]